METSTRSKKRSKGTENNSDLEKKEEKAEEFVNIFSVARKALLLSAIPDSLPGRETEKQEILKFVRTNIFAKGGACLCKLNI